MSQPQITGQHHVSMITKDAKQNLWFYTEVLGLRLVKNRKSGRSNHVPFILWQL